MLAVATRTVDLECEIFLKYVPSGLPSSRMLSSILGGAPLRRTPPRLLNGCDHHALAKFKVSPARGGGDGSQSASLIFRSNYLAEFAVVLARGAPICSLINGQSSGIFLLPRHPDAVRYEACWLRQQLYGPQARILLGVFCLVSFVRHRYLSAPSRRLYVDL